MKFGVISNSMLGVHGIHFLSTQKKIAGVAIPDRLNEANRITKEICNQFSIPLEIISENQKPVQLKKWLQSIQPDTVLAAGCPFKITEHDLGIPEKGFWNIHAGKLPEYAGPDPIFWQIRNRAQKVEITVHKMTAQIDAGPVLTSIPMEIEEGLTYGQVWQKLQQMAPTVFQQIVSILGEDSYKLKSQSTATESFNKRPTQEDMIINWNTMDADEIIALVNACNPNYGGAFGLFRGGYIRILRLKKITKSSSANPGEIIKADSENLWVQTKDNQPLSVEITNMAEGYLTGADLIKMDIRSGDQFDSP